MQVLLISTYELGHQPFGLASPAAWLRRAGFDVACADVSREPLDEAWLARAGLAAFYLPMHTATRLALPIIERLKAIRPECHLCAYGIYAPLNERLLRASGIDTILGGEFEADLVGLAERLNGSSNGSQPTAAGRPGVPRLPFIQPDRSGLPPLERYASLVQGDDRRTAGYTEASRGCKHACRHCPIVPVYNGRFRVVPVDVVAADIRAQVERGATHITFGDPDFFNGIGHALRVVGLFEHELRGVTYDVTIKVEHLLRHARHLPALAESGCLFVTSAVEALDDRVLALLAKGHTRADFFRAVDACREARLALSPTFVAFTPWTTLAAYLDLLETLERLDLVAHVPPIQLALRLLIPDGSLLLELEEVRRLIGPFDAATLVHPWRHPDPAVDALQREVMEILARCRGAARDAVFAAVREAAERYVRAAGGDCRRPHPAAARARATVPYLDEPWYC